MAEMASEIVKFFGEKLFSWGLQEIAFAKHIGSHVESLVDTKIIIEALLQDADRVQLPRQALLLLERLSCVVDEVDDFTDRKEARAKMKQLMGRRRWFAKQVLLFLSASAFRDSGKVGAIRKELDSIAKDAQFGTLLSLPYQTSLVTESESRSNTATKEVRGSLYETWSIVNKDGVIGRERDRGQVVHLLLGSGSNEGPETLSVVSIVGMGGIGKTTLAQYVYDDDIVKVNFELNVWVWASENFDIEEVLMKILESVSNENPERYVLNKLQDRVREKISGKKFFLVLDNVLDDENWRLTWGKLEIVLRCGAPGSSVLITTRNESVASLACTGRNTYMLEGLDPEASWILFQRIAFRAWQDSRLEPIGKEIARMCKNVPLVIHTIAALLAEKRTVAQWQSFRDGEFASLSVYGGNVIQTLKLSYNPLDPWLKFWVAFSSLFPKGYMSDKHELINVLIALAYIRKEYDQNKSLIDAGEECLGILVNRGFFHVIRPNIGHFIGTEQLMMHDLIHDLAISVAGCKFKTVKSKSDKINKEVRYLSIGKEVDICFEAQSKPRHLRSLLVHGRRSTIPKLKGWSSCFPYLRVLSLKSSGMKEVPSDIFKLIQLRHLDLSFNDFSEVPKSIKGLVNLLSLNLSCCFLLQQLPGEIGGLSSLLSLDLLGCDSLEKLPNEMSKLVKLRRLRLKWCDALRKMPIGLGNLTELQRLDWFFAEDSSPSDVGGGLSELNTLTNLEGHLEIKLRTILNDTWKANLEMKDKLEALTIEFRSLEGKHEEVLEGLKPHSHLRELTILDYKGKSLPKWMMKNDELPCSLVDIRIENAVNLKCLPSFGRLPHLKDITLRNLESVEYMEEEEEEKGGPVNVQGEASISLFPRLETLYLDWMPRLKGWRRMPSSRNTNEWARPPCFPRLKSLTVGGEFEVFPDEFRGVSSLQTLEIYHCDKMRELGDWIDEFTSLKTLSLLCCPEMKALPKQIGNLPNLMEISIGECPGAYEEWWEDPTFTHPDCPLNNLSLPPQMPWKSSYKYDGHYFSCKRVS